MGFFGDFFGGQDTVGSPNATEGQQRINEQLSIFGFSQALGGADLANYLLTGQFSPSYYYIPNGRSVSSSIQAVPNSSAFNLIQGGINNELLLSDIRNQLASGILQNFAGSAPAGNQFINSQIGFGNRAIPSQEQMYRDLFATGQQNLGLQNQLANNISNYIASGGAGSWQTEQNIGRVFDAQRQQVVSDLNKQYADRLLDLGEFTVTRGLNPTDTPIQDRGGRLTEEYIRNVQDAMVGLGGQQANALLQFPFQQQQMNLGALFNTQGANLNALNAFSVPITNAFNAQNTLNAQGQFGLQYSPFATAGIPLQNANALLGGGTQYAANTPTFSPFAAIQSPNFAQNFGQSFATSLGSGLGQSVNGAIGGAASYLGGGFGGGGPFASLRGTTGFNY